jgi:hypothetical protein
VATSVVVMISLAVASVVTAAFKGPALGEIARAVVRARIHHYRYKTLRYTLKHGDNVDFFIAAITTLPDKDS